MLCFTEHWLNCHKLCAININHSTLDNVFCRRNGEHGGSYIFVRKGVITKELNSLIELGEEKNFELSVTELVQYAIIVICIYRSPDGRLDTFFKKLEVAVQKLVRKHKTLIFLWRLEYKFSSIKPTKKVN